MAAHLIASISEIAPFQEFVYRQYAALREEPKRT
jgi:hypothetical protein